MSAKKAYIIGVGMTAFEKPRNRVDYPELGAEATVKALLDAGVNYDDVQQAYVGYCYGDSTCGQRALYLLGNTGIPVFNVNNNCSTGSSALWLAANAVRSGQASCALALGFEKMAAGSLASAWMDRSNPLEGTLSLLSEIQEEGGVDDDFGPFAARIFGAAGDEYCAKYGARAEHIAKIAAKNHAHSVANPYSQFRVSPSPQEVLKSRKITRSLTLPMCSPTSDGGAAAVVASEEFVRSKGLENWAVELCGMGMATDSARLYEDRSAIELAGADMTRKAAQNAFEEAGVTPQDVQVIELHDCFASNELVTYPALGLCADGDAHKIVDAGDNTYGGKWVINPSGGLESKGHPLGATGIGMAKYIVDQVRGVAGALQAPNVRYGLSHNIGLGGSCAVNIYAKPAFWKDGGETGVDRLGYNAGDTCKPITPQDLDKVKSKRQWSAYVPARL